VELKPLDASTPNIEQIGMEDVQVSDAGQCAEYIQAFLFSVCTLRLVYAAHQHTPFVPPANAPFPRIPKAWTFFFGSVIEAALPSTMTIPLPGLEEKPALEVMERVTKLALTPWSSPAGETHSAATTAAVAKEASATAIANAKARKGVEHLLLSASDSIENARKMSSGLFSEFKTVQTIPNEAEAKMLTELYIRTRTHPAYAKLQVIRLQVSEAYGNTMIRVFGQGQHFCQIAGGRAHGHAPIYFLVKRKTGELTQHCLHSGCKDKHYSFGVISDEDVRIIFSPMELLKQRGDKLTAHQRQLAAQLLASSAGKGLASKETKSKIKSTQAVPPVSSALLLTASPFPLRVECPSYDEIAQGQDLDETREDGRIAPPPPTVVESDRDEHLRRALVHRTDPICLLPLMEFEAVRGAASVIGESHAPVSARTMGMISKPIVSVEPLPSCVFALGDVQKT
jgi:hypothetical protein